MYRKLFFYCILFYICLFENGIWFWGKIKKKHRTRVTFSSLMNKVICISSHFLVTQLNNVVLLCSPNCTPNLCYFNNSWQEVPSGYLPINSQQGIYFPSCNLWVDLIDLYSRQNLRYQICQLEETHSFPINDFKRDESLVVGRLYLSLFSLGQKSSLLSQLSHFP